MTVHNKMRNANLFPHWFCNSVFKRYWTLVHICLGEKKYWSTTQLALSKHFRCLLNFLGSKTRPLTKNDETLSNMRAFSTFCQVSIIFFLIALQKKFQLMTLLVSTLFENNSHGTFKSWHERWHIFFWKKAWPWHSFSTSQQDDVATLNLS